MAGLGHRQDRGVMLPPLDEIDGFMVRPGFYNSEGAVPTARGVSLKAFLKMEADKINAIQVSDLNKKNIGTLRAYAKSGKAPGQFIEVMACEGGCITGPSTHSGSNNGKRQLVQELAKQKKTY